MRKYGNWGWLARDESNGAAMGSVVESIGNELIGFWGHRKI